MSAGRFVSSPGTAMTLAGLAVAATVFWILWGADSTTRSSHFVSTPQFILWVLILGGLSAVLVLAVWPVTVILWRLVSDLRSRGGLDGPMWFSLAVGWVVYVVLVAFPLYVRQLPWSSTIADEVPDGDEWPLWHHELKLTTVTAASLLVAFLTIGGIWFVGIALARMSSENEEENQPGRFFALRDDFTVLLAIGGTLLGLSMFATAALRSAVIAAEPESGYDFGFILAFGLWFKRFARHCLRAELRGASQRGFESRRQGASPAGRHGLKPRRDAREAPRARATPRAQPDSERHREGRCRHRLTLHWKPDRTLDSGLSSRSSRDDPSSFGGRMTRASR